jgi:hypothetical protein
VECVGDDILGPAPTRVVTSTLACLLASPLLSASYDRRVESSAFRCLRGDDIAVISIVNHGLLRQKTSETTSLTRPLIRPLIHSFTHSLTRTLIRPLIHPLTHSFTHSLTHSLAHSFAHSFTPAAVVFTIILDRILKSDLILVPNQPGPNHNNNM